MIKKTIASSALLFLSFSSSAFADHQYLVCQSEVLVEVPSTDLHSEGGMTEEYQKVPCSEKKSFLARDGQTPVAFKKNPVAKTAGDYEVNLSHGTYLYMSLQAEKESPSFLGTVQIEDAGEENKKAAFSAQIRSSDLKRRVICSIGPKPPISKLPQFTAETPVETDKECKPEEESTDPYHP